MGKEIEIYEGEFLYEKNGFYYIRNGKGVIEKITKNHFKSGEIVKTTDKHFSQKSFTRVINPCYTKTRGWVYTENYTNRNVGSGGCGSAFEENLYAKLTDPADILFAERRYLNETISKLKNDLKQKESKLEKILFALNLAVPNYERIIDKCGKCGTLYGKDNEGNVNKNICKECTI